MSYDNEAANQGKTNKKMLHQNKSIDAALKSEDVSNEIKERVNNRGIQPQNESNNQSSSEASSELNPDEIGIEYASDEIEECDR